MKPSEIYDTFFQEEVGLKSPHVGMYDARRLARKRALVEVLEDFSTDPAEHIDKIKFVLKEIINGGI